jgi:hypothetical protein
VCTARSGLVDRPDGLAVKEGKGGKAGGTLRRSESGGASLAVRAIQFLASIHLSNICQTRCNSKLPFWLLGLTTSTINVANAPPHTFFTSRNQPFKIRSGSLYSPLPLRPRYLRRIKCLSTPLCSSSSAQKLARPPIRLRLLFSHWASCLFGSRAYVKSFHDPPSHSVQFERKGLWASDAHWRCTAVAASLYDICICRRQRGPRSPITATRLVLCSVSPSSLLLRAPM